MSYRDLRNFTEHLRALGFPSTVSLESFRQPNFPLLVQLLLWLTERLDPEVRLDGGPHTMEDRVLIIRSVAQFMATKANIKLNMKRLYGADGYAVRELIKITSVLYEALTMAEKENQHNEDDDDDEDPFQFDMSSKIDELKRARHLATEITANGALLYDILGKEVDYKEIRSQAISRPLDMTLVDSAVEKACLAYQRELESIQEQLENVSASEAALDAKIAKRRQELERGEKRLEAMQKIKPAYQAEFRSHEVELEKLHDDYVLKLRCIEALKQQLSGLEAAEAEVAEERRLAALKLIQKYEADDVLVNLSDADDYEYEESPRKELKEVEKRPATRPRTRLRVRTAAGRAEQSKVFGSMGTGDKAEDDLSIGDSLGDEDDILGDNLDEDDLKALDIDGSDDLGSLGSSSGESGLMGGPAVSAQGGPPVPQVGRGRGQGQGRRPPSPHQGQDPSSDDDF